VKKLDDIMEKYGLPKRGLKADKYQTIKNFLSLRDCVECREKKKLCEYRKLNRINGYSKKCLECEKAFCKKEIQYKEEVRKPVIDVTKAKVCSVCKVLTSFEDYYKNGANKIGIESRCKYCSSKEKVGTEKIRRIVKAPMVPVGYKWCPKCTITKLKSDFYSSNKRSDGCQHSCKQCYNEIKVKNRLKNKISKV
jgi:hypothetical protein